MIDRRVVASVCALLFAGGCSPKPASDAVLETLAKTKVTKELSDLTSITFRDVKQANGKYARKMGEVCGEVNGKNSRGEAIGFRSFVFVRHSDVAIVDYGMATSGGDQLLASICGHGYKVLKAGSSYAPVSTPSGQINA